MMSLNEAKQVAATVLTICPHCKGDAKECGGLTYVKRYDCPQCGTQWTDTWCCACNDRCPGCDLEVEPYDYDGPDDDGEFKESEAMKQ